MIMSSNAIKKARKKEKKEAIRIGNIKCAIDAEIMRKEIIDMRIAHEIAGRIMHGTVSKQKIAVRDEDYEEMSWDEFNLKWK